MRRKQLKAMRALRRSRGDIDAAKENFNDMRNTCQITRTEFSVTGCTFVSSTRAWDAWLRCLDCVDFLIMENILQETSSVSYLIIAMQNRRAYAV